jgi:hypothetical protein
MNKSPEGSMYRMDIMKGSRARFSCGKTEVVTVPGIHASAYQNR